MTKHARTLKTQGIHPKTIAAAALPLIIGMALAIIDKLLLGDSIDDAVWIAALGLSPAVGASAYRAPAAPTRVVPHRDYRTDGGYGVIEVLLICFLAILALIALVVLVHQL